MTTYYCHTLEEALKRAKAAGKRPGCWYGGIVLKSGRRGFAIYREGKVPKSIHIRQTNFEHQEKDGLSFFVSSKVCSNMPAGVDQSG